MTLSDLLRTLNWYSTFHWVTFLHTQLKLNYLHSPFSLILTRNFLYSTVGYKKLRLGWDLWLWHFLYSVGPHQVSSLNIYTFVVSRSFMAGAASQAGDADSSRAPGLTSGLQWFMNVHHGALLLVPHWQRNSSFVFYISWALVEAKLKLKVVILFEIRLKGNKCTVMLIIAKSEHTHEKTSLMAFYLQWCYLLANL